MEKLIKSVKNILIVGFTTSAPFYLTLACFLTCTVADGKTCASTESFPSLKKFATSNFVEDFRPTVLVPLTDSLSGRPVGLMSPIRFEGKSDNNKLLPFTFTIHFCNCIGVLNRCIKFAFQKFAVLCFPNSH